MNKMKKMWTINKNRILFNVPGDGSGAHKTLTPSDRKTLTLYRQEYIISAHDEPIRRLSTRTHFVIYQPHSTTHQKHPANSRHKQNQHKSIWQKQRDGKETHRTNTTHNTHIKCSFYLEIQTKKRFDIFPKNWYVCLVRNTRMRRSIKHARCVYRRKKSSMTTTRSYRKQPPTPNRQRRIYSVPE